MKNKDKFIIAKKNYSSRLIVGTGKYKSMIECAKAKNLRRRYCDGCSKKSKYIR